MSGNEPAFPQSVDDSHRWFNGLTALIIGNSRSDSPGPIVSAAMDFADEIIRQAATRS